MDFIEILEILDRHIWKKDLIVLSWDRDKYGFNLRWIGSENGKS